MAGDGKGAADAPGFGKAATAAARDVKPGDLLYAPEAYPQGLWGRVIGVLPDWGRPEYLRVDMDGSPPVFGNAQSVSLKADGAVRLKRPLPPDAAEREVFGGESA